MSDINIYVSANIIFTAYLLKIQNYVETFIFHFNSLNLNVY